MTKRTAGLLISLLLILWVRSARPQDQKQCDIPVAFTDAKYVPGQVWAVKGRTFELNPTITILKVESLPKTGEVIHVRLDGIRLRNCSGGPEPNHIQYAPFTRAALEESVTQLVRIGTIPVFEEGYTNWLSNCGGVYTIPVMDMLTVDEKTFNARSGCTA